MSEQSESQALSIFDVRVRVGPAAKARGLVRPFAEGVAQSLAVRSVSGDRPLDLHEMASLGGIAETWASAWSLTRTLERPDEINSIDADGVPLTHLYSEHCYGASFVPFLRDLIDIGPQGALVSMPLGHSVVVHPMSTVEVGDAFRAMIPIARQVHASGPAPVSPHVYWWRDGGLTFVPTYFGRNGVDFRLPNGLAARLSERD